MQDQASKKLSYKEACRLAKKNPSTRYISDAGDGWTTETYYNPAFKRLVSISINPDGMRI